MLTPLFLGVMVPVGCLVIACTGGWKEAELTHSTQVPRAMPRSTTANATGERHGGRATMNSSALLWAPVVNLTSADWVIFIRIQKTGSQTLKDLLSSSFDGSRLWGRHFCQRGLFCCKDCASFVKKQMRAIRQEHKCKLITRPHTNIYDFVQGSRTAGVERQALHFLTFLREPVARALSEFRHVTSGISARLGEAKFGRAWDYNLSLPMSGNKSAWDEVTIAYWLSCTPCSVGSRNRMTQFMSGAFTTGEQGHSAHTEELLNAAKANLETSSYFGLTERFEVSIVPRREPRFPILMSGATGLNPRPEAHIPHRTGAHEILFY